MKQYRAVIFDWDGTIMNSTAAIVASIQGACADLGLPVPDARRAGWIIGLSHESALYHVAPDLKAEQVPMFRERFRARYAAQEAGLPLFEGMTDLLAGLRSRGVLLAVATGKTRLGLDRVLNQCLMHEAFDATRCADETQSKPHPAMLQEIMETLYLQPQEVLMVGDTSHDIQMAHNAGVDGLAVSYGAHNPDELSVTSPVAVMDSVGGMQAWLADRIAG